VNDGKVIEALVNQGFNMATWIFQGNPNIFDIDGYLEACSGDFHWQVSRDQENLSVQT
jgi:hypothetical protein